MALELETSFSFSYLNVSSSLCVEVNLVICYFRLLLNLFSETISICSSSCISLKASKPSQIQNLPSVSSMVEDSSFELVIKHTFATSSLEELEDVDTLSS